jgi:hypothetical protein
MATRRSVFSSLFTRDQDQLAEEVLVFEILLGTPNLGERVTAGQEGYQPALCYVAHEVGEVFTCTQGRADQLQVLEVHGPQVEPHHRTGDGPGNDVAPLGSEYV